MDAQLVLVISIVIHPTAYQTCVYRIQDSDVGFRFVSTHHIDHTLRTEQLNADHSSIHFIFYIAVKRSQQVTSSDKENVSGFICLSGYIN